MINKTNFKKVLKAAMKGRAFFDGNIICDGYFLMKVNPELKQEITKTVGTENNFIFENGDIKKDNLNFPNFETLISGTEKNQEFKFTGYTKKADKYESYILCGEDGTLIYIDKKYMELFEDTKSMNIYGSTAINPLIFETLNNDFVALILPIRPGNLENGFKIVRDQES